MKTPPPLSPELEAWLAPHRAAMPLAPSVEARAVARAVASRAVPLDPSFGPRRSVFAGVVGAVLVLGAAAYGARAWIVGPSSRAAAAPATIMAPRVSAPRPPADDVDEQIARAAACPGSAETWVLAPKQNVGPFGTIGFAPCTIGA